MKDYFNRTPAEIAEERERKAKSLAFLLKEAGLDVEAGKAAMLAFHRWETNERATEWTQCGYPGGVIDALKAYLQKSPTLPNGWQLVPITCGGCGAPSTSDCYRSPTKPCYREFHHEGTRQAYAGTKPKPNDSDPGAIEHLNTIVDAWEALPGGRQVRTKDVEKWLAEAVAPAINAIREFLNRPKPEVSDD